MENAGRWGICVYSRLSNDIHRPPRSCPGPDSPEQVSPGAITSKKRPSPGRFFCVGDVTMGSLRCITVRGLVVSHFLDHYLQKRPKMRVVSHYLDHYCHTVPTRCGLCRENATFPAQDCTEKGWRVQRPPPYSNLAAMSERSERSPLRRSTCSKRGWPFIFSPRWVRPLDHWSR